jgi:hypothetical protein
MTQNIRTPNPYNPIVTDGVGVNAGGGWSGIAPSMYPDAQARDVFRRMEQLLNSKQQDALDLQPNVRNKDWRNKAIYMRMRWERAPFEAFFTHYISATETVVLFIVYKDTAVTLTDDAAMFPSDTLVTQLRLLTS